MIKCAADKSCVVVEDLKTGCSRRNSRATVSGGFLMMEMTVLLSWFLVWNLEYFLLRGQNTRQRIAADGRERPHEPFGRLNEPKGGVAPAQAAFLVRGLFPGVRACSRLVWRRLRDRATERESLNSARTLRVFVCSVYAAIAERRKRCRLMRLVSKPTRRCPLESENSSASRASGSSPFSQDS